jgi:hypothetical protein
MPNIIIGEDRVFRDGFFGSGLGTAVTENFTVDAVWDTPNVEYGGLDSVQECSFQLTFQMNTGDEGIIWETGGGGDGSILYVYNGDLYWDSADGTILGDNPSSGNVEIIYPSITGGTCRAEVSFSVNGGKTALYINGTLVDVKSAGFSRIGGSNKGGIGGAVGPTGGGDSATVRGADFDFQRVITDGAYIYIGETTSDV